MSSFSINGLSSNADAAASTSRIHAVGAVGDDGEPGIGETAASDEDAVSIDTMPSSPPPEVMAAIASAADAYEEMAAQGRYVSFGADPTTGGLAIQVQDKDGTVLSALKPSQVLGIADGDAMDQTGKSADVHLQRLLGL